ETGTDSGAWCPPSAAFSIAPRSFRHQQELRALDGGRHGGVATGLDGPDGPDLEPRPLGEQTELAWRVAGGPQVGGHGAAGLVPGLRPLGVDAAVRVEAVPVLQPPPL